MTQHDDELAAALRRATADVPPSRLDLHDVLRGARGKARRSRAVTGVVGVLGIAAVGAGVWTAGPLLAGGEAAGGSHGPAAAGPAVPGVEERDSTWRCLPQDPSYSILVTADGVVAVEPDPVRLSCVVGMVREEDPVELAEVERERAVRAAEVAALGAELRASIEGLREADAQASAEAWRDYQECVVEALEAGEEIRAVLFVDRGDGGAGPAVRVTRPECAPPAP